MKKDGREVLLSALEYRLLLVFINNPGNIITRDRLLNELWDAAGEFVTDNTLTVYIKRLREKIEDNPPILSPVTTLASSPEAVRKITGISCLCLIFNCPRDRVPAGRELCYGIRKFVLVLFYI